MPLHRDTASLWDMREAAGLIRDFLGSTVGDDYTADVKTQSAVERQLITIGEAARRVSGTFRAAHPEISWVGIIAHRNYLTHEYDDVKTDLVWEVATTGVTALVAQLDALLESQGPPLT